MTRHFHEEILALKKKILEMSFMVEEGVAQACEALLTGDTNLAVEVIEGERHINNLEIEIDEKGHQLFALGQPMAGDLRLITMILKINTDLERMGDHAVNIAEKALFIMKEPSLRLDPYLQKIGGTVQEMLRHSLDAFLKDDVLLARKVLEKDDEVDDLNAGFYFRLKQLMEEKPSTVGAGLNWLMVSHNLERVADLACNIAEDVIYMIQGKEVRHNVAGSQT